MAPTYTASSSSDVRIGKVIADMSLSPRVAPVAPNRSRYIVRKSGNLHVVPEPANVPPEISRDWAVMKKYWKKRHILFSRYDSGVRMDHESWFSVTPEPFAIATAKRFRCDVVVDAFCGAGGNTIQFAKTCKKVIAIDIDPLKVDMARHNANIYGVAHRIEFIVGDFFKLSDTLRADAVFLGPPWGGPDYKNIARAYDIERDLMPLSATEVMRKALRVSSNVAMYLPRNSDRRQVNRLATLLPKNQQIVEIDEMTIQNYCPGITAYFGNLVKRTNLNVSWRSNLS